LAALQKRAIGLRSELLACGARDQSISVLREHCSEMVDFLDEALSRQTSTKGAPLGHQRLAEIGAILQDACSNMDALNIPDTVIHGDMNRGNILLDGSNCRFIDWSEAYLGNPFLNFQHLSLLNTGEHKEVNAVRMKQAYRRSWLDLLEPMHIDRAFALSPLLAVASYLYGRGDWLRSSRRNDPDLGSYACILARHMDRAASAPELKEALCR
jgi:Phosphotransferase enzyme family